MAVYKGLIRARRNGQEVPNSPWLARMRVPKDVRDIAAALPVTDPRRALFMGPNGKAKLELVETTRLVDIKDARKRGERILGDWKRRIADLRLLAAPEELLAVLTRIEDWRAHRVGVALGFDAMIALFSAPAGGKVAMEGGKLTLVSQEPSDLDTLDDDTPGVSHGAAAWARSYFAADPGKSTAISSRPGWKRLIEKLEAVSQGTHRWREVEGFDEHLRAEIGGMDSKVLVQVRPTFARAWKEVAQAEEAERRYAAALLALAGAAMPLQVYTDPSTTYQPTSDDRTMGELMTAYRAAKPGKDAIAPTRALEEFLGTNTPVKSVTRSDARAFLALVLRLPANATKLYPDLTMVAAADAAQRDKRALLSPGSQRRYMTFASMVWNWAIDEGDGLWAVVNPFSGLAPDGTAVVTRRGFSNDELVKLFAHLAPHKAEDSYLYWAPALLLGSPRLGEVCQLRVDDVRQTDTGEWFLDIGLRDAKNRIDPKKSVKNAESIRLAPIHPVVVKAGFAEFMKRRRASGDERLFPDVKCREAQEGDKTVYDWSHYPSKAFGEIIGEAIGDDPSLVAHSFRHGFRTRAEEAGVPDAILDAIAGWSQKTVGRKYGQRDVPLLAENLAKLDYGALAL